MWRDASAGLAPTGLGADLVASMRTGRKQSTSRTLLPSSGGWTEGPELWFAFRAAAGFSQHRKGGNDSHRAGSRRFPQLGALAQQVPGDFFLDFAEIDLPGIVLWLRQTEALFVLPFELPPKVVEPVLDAIVGAAWDHLGHLGPLTTGGIVQPEDGGILHGGPLRRLEAGVEMIDVSLAALLAGPAGQ